MSERQERTISESLKFIDSIYRILKNPKTTFLANISLIDKTIQFATSFVLSQTLLKVIC